MNTNAAISAAKPSNQPMLRPLRRIMGSFSSSGERASVGASCASSTRPADRSSSSAPLMASLCLTWRVISYTPLRKPRANRQINRVCSWAKAQRCKLLNFGNAGRPKRAVALFQRFRRLQHRLDMARHFHLPPDPAKDAVPVDQEGGALDTHIFAAIHALLRPNPIGLAYLAVFVRREREGRYFVLNLS